MRKSIVIFLLLAHHILLPTAADRASGTAIIDSACRRTHDFDLCFNTVINKFPPDRFDYKGPFDVAQSLLQSFGYYVLDEQHRLTYYLSSLHRDTFPPLAQQWYKCTDSYDKMYIQDYYTAYDKLVANDFISADQAMRKAKARAHACDEGFRKLERWPESFLNENQVTYKYALITADVIHLLL